MSVTFVALFATFLLVATANAATPSFEDRHLVRANPPTSRNPSAYRLPGSTVPIRYRVNLVIDPDHHDSFSGVVEIDIIAIQDTNKIVLHAHTDMTVGNITMNKITGSDIFQSVNHSRTDDHFLKITLSSMFNAQERAVLRIEFIGKYGEVEGVYLSSYKAEDNTIRYLATTQFQAVSAREAFPCYDEPHLKAIFTLLIYHPEKYHAISNTNEDEIAKPPPKPNLKATIFRDTPKMSTYLVAFIVSDFVSINNTQNQVFPNRKFGVYARPNAADSLDFSLDFAQRSLLDLQKYTSFTYELTKMDKAAIPDFSAGAMENWGLVTYREEYLLHKEGKTSKADEHLIAAVISHENAHMWFGNEVTPSWWSYLWLSEGFATYFEYYTTDSVLNFKYRMMEQFVVTYMQGVMRSDATTSTNAMTNDLGSPAEIDNNFNGIAYDKSGSVIRMIQHILGEEAFQTGLRAYLRKLESSVTEPKELFDALDAVATNLPSGLNISNVFESWSTQKGFPVVSALPTNSRKFVEFYQTRYYQETKQTSLEKWYIPLAYAVRGDLFNDTTAQRWLMPNEILVVDLNVETDWFIVNKHQMGYFRVMYDKFNWIFLGEALKKENHDGIPPLNRAQLMDDAYAFATSLRLSFNVTLDLLSYLKDENDFIPWITAERLLNNFDILMEASMNNQIYRKITTEWSQKLYDKFGLDASSDDTPIDRIHRDIVLSLQCNAGISDARRKANLKIKNILDEPGYVIDPDLISTTYCCGLRDSSQEEWNVIFQKYLEAPRPTERFMVLRTLGCTENKMIAENYFNMSIQEDSAVIDEDRFRIVLAMINGGGKGLEYSLDFLNDEFPKFQNMTAEYFGGLRVISALQNRVVSGLHLNKFWAFYIRQNATFTSLERAAMNNAAVVIGDRNAWLYTALREIDPWLIENAPGSGGTLANVSKILLALCAIFLMYLY